MTMRVACVMMQKDETLLLEGWIRYHAQLFGLRNLHVIDNGSTNRAVRATLARFETLGMHVDRSFCRPQDFADKGIIATQIMRRLRDAGGHDFLFPLDCDEFVALRTGTGFTAAPHLVHAALAPLRNHPEALKIDNEFRNNPRCPGWFHLIYCNKSFYAAPSFSHTDHGFHCAGALGTDRFRTTRIAHVHYHNKPFRRLRADARRKLRGLGTDPDDPAALAALSHSRHLLAHLQQTRRQHLERFDALPHVHAPEFMRRLALCGATGGALLRPCRDDQQHPRIPLPDAFDPDAYLAAHADLRSNGGMDPLLHYSIAGHREGRVLRR